MDPKTWIARNNKTGIEYKISDKQKTSYENAPITAGKFSFEKIAEAKQPIEAKKAELKPAEVPAKEQH